MDIVVQSSRMKNLQDFNQSISSGRGHSRPHHDDAKSAEKSSKDTIPIRPFPLKLHTMLEDAESKGFEDIISWQDSGKSFKVHKPDAFVTNVMKSYFNQTKYKSFQRQLNLYGFMRIRSTKGSYAHISFVRDRPSLSEAMARHKIRTTQKNTLGRLSCFDRPPHT